MSPLVSVVIPTHNRSDLLRRAIASVKCQTYKSIEIIVVNDASSDNTDDVVNSFEDIVYLKNQRNSGISITRNIGMKIALGKYIALLDDDDEFLPTKIEEQLIISEELNKTTLVLCGGYKDRSQIIFSLANGFIDRNNLFQLRAKLPNPSAWFFPRKIIENIGYFDENLMRWEDADYCVRIMQHAPVYMINKPLVIWHSSQGSITSSGFCKEDVFAREYFLFKHFELMKEKDLWYGYRFCWRLGKDLKEIKMIEKSKEAFRKSFLIKPYKLEAIFQAFDILPMFMIMLLCFVLYLLAETYGVRRE